MELVIPYGLNILIAFDLEDESNSLFSTAWTRYQIITEELLSKEDAFDPLLVEFKKRSGYGNYFCRHQNCPRAVRGFNSELHRDAHEESHIPKFRCVDSKCNMPEQIFKSRAALRKHTKKYHETTTTASIPSSLHALTKTV